MDLDAHAIGVVHLDVWRLGIRYVIDAVTERAIRSANSAATPAR